MSTQSQLKSFWEGSNVLVEAEMGTSQLAQSDEKFQRRRNVIFVPRSRLPTFLDDNVQARDFLTVAEIADIEASWKEIEEGRAKKFKSVNEFLEEIKT